MDVTEIAAQLDALDKRYADLRNSTKHDDLSGGDPQARREVQRLSTRTIAAAHRLLPLNSAYRTQADQLVAMYTGRGTVGNPGGLVVDLLEVLRAFREDVEDGFLVDLEASINAGVFADFLEMADHVLAEIDKTAAAVIAGFTLEEHLRKMCGAIPIPVAQSNGAPKKADTLNAELAKAGAYSSKTELKDVTAWLGRRNDAAHGHHDQYSIEQVRLMIEGVRAFISRHPA